MTYEELSPADRARYAAKLAALRPGDTLTIRFTSRGTRKARVTRIARTGTPYVETYSPSRGRWSPARPLDVAELVVS